MPLRLAEIVVPGGRAEEASGLFDRDRVLGVWVERLDEDLALLRVLMQAEDTEPAMDALEQRFSDEACFKLLLLGVEATLPRPPEPEDGEAGGGAGEAASGPMTEAAKAEQSEAPSGEEASATPAGERISREELYTDLAEHSRLSMTYLATVVLSTAVAAIGMLRGEVAVIIGAMVIAPLLGPNMSLSLATALGDGKLALRSLKTNGAGLGLALALSLGIGLLFPIDPTLPELLSRSHVELAHVVLALASGFAGALAFTRGVSAALVGVMVAVALLPPLVAFGLMLPSGSAVQALGALLLLLTSVVCVNLAGVATFLLLGIRPSWAWEADRARRASRVALGLWLGLLAVLVAALLLARGR